LKTGAERTLEAQQVRRMATLVIKKTASGELVNNNDHELIDESAITNDDNDWMFPPTLIDELRRSHPHLRWPEDDVRLRPLRMSDYDRGYLSLLAQLTSVDTVDRDAFDRRFRSMSCTRPHAYYVLVVADADDRPIATATLVIEWKFIHAAGSRGRIEDVVVAHDVRGRHFGTLLNQWLAAIAEHVGVYKLSLECTDRLIGFYEQFGFRKDDGNNFMVRRFDAKI
jgi:glucosamine-phosphate N-acetyltransferase